ncbi:MAG: TIGR04283 family arsenosugar biosynthesis glycosyltransferase [Herminiimonas sp.]|nr:TIGR04283 family arsenosugar biosynthesis glycosyltransferase [Herminiimonas sp.]
MRISIIIPVLNEAGQVAARMQALASLRADGAELLVADGGSIDGTAHLAAPFADRVLVGALGRALQMNAGADIASGEILLFLHADTTLPSGALALIRQALSGSRHAWGRFDVAIDGRPRMLKVIATMMNLRSRMTGIATGDQAIFVRRETFAAIGGYPPQALMEDIELSRRLKRCTPPCCLRQRVVTSGRRWETRGVWRTILLMWRLRWLYWRGVSPDKLAAVYR